MATTHTTLCQAAAENVLLDLLYSHWKEVGASR